MTAIIIIIVLILLVVGWFFGIYNKLIKLRNKKDDQWSQIAIQLKRRADLIPNVVETVKGYAKHEKSTFEDVVKARNTYVTASTPEDEIKASGAVTEALNKLFALAESYPDLKANENFIKLQEDLKETEDKISYARQFYNDAVRKYNDQVQMVPSNIVANFTGFKPATYFEGDEKDKEAPKVEFE